MKLRYHGSEQKFPLLPLDAHYYVSEDQISHKEENWFTCSSKRFQDWHGTSWISIIYQFNSYSNLAISIWYRTATSSLRYHMFITLRIILDVPRRHAFCSNSIWHCISISVTHKSILLVILFPTSQSQLVQNNIFSISITYLSIILLLYIIILRRVKIRSVSHEKNQQWQLSRVFSAVEHTLSARGNLDCTRQLYPMSHSFLLDRVIPSLRGSPTLALSFTRELFYKRFCVYCAHVQVDTLLYLKAVNRKLLTGSC